ncbi:MAG TPA: hypothetical protein VMH90_02345 [Thermoplasmata archaeon]|nr:hypothetical protein [Thermoplasmata archaeon]
MIVGRLATAITVGTALVLLLTSLGASAAPAPMGASPPQQWTYASQGWDNRSGNVSHGPFNVSYSVEAYYLAQYGVTATNTSATTTEMQGIRNLTMTYALMVCSPNCSAPQYSQNLTLTSWEQQVQFLNFTTNATVDENGTAAPALGITNVSASSTSALWETGTNAWGNHSSTMTLNMSQVSTFSVQFAPALGLVPWNLSQNLTWNSTSAFNASGGWNDSYSTSGAWGGSSYTRNGTYSGTVNRSGRESVWGKDFGNHTWQNASTVILGLRYHGPFDFDNGLFMTAVGSDLFQGATANWTVFTHPGFSDASEAVTAVYAEHAPSAAPTGPSSGSTSGGTDTTGTGTASGSSGGTSTPPGGTSGVTPPIVGTPPSQIPSPSPAPVAQPSTPSSSPTHSTSSASWLLPLLGVLAGVGVVGAVAASRWARPKKP